MTTARQLALRQVRADAERQQRAPALDVQGLTKSFRSGGRLPTFRRPRGSGARHVAVDDVSFRIEPGEIYGVIGANGSGKSTLVRILSTLLLPDRGAVFVYGRDAVHDPSAVRPMLNRVSADPSFFRAMSPAENLLFFGRAYGLSGDTARRRSAEILERLGLEEGRSREPMRLLSRGQQQKVAVARAFLTSPQLMLLDEPTTGLDPRSKHEVQRFVAEVRGESGVSVLLTTHDMAEAEVLCDRLAFLAGGRIVAEGTPLGLRRQVAGARPLEQVDMETVFMELTGRRIEEDESEGAGDGDG
ncbi:MAG: ABC transporter ATP-binding protein [Acidimicrobiales bacterium]|nr:ABC transporter ATP-binding protein [Acidimicrobiales bacterium]